MSQYEIRSPSGDLLARGETIDACIRQLVGKQDQYRQIVEGYQEMCGQIEMLDPTSKQMNESENTFTAGWWACHKAIIDIIKRR